MITRARLIARSWTDGKYRNALDAWDIRSWPVPWRQLLLIMVRASLLCSTNLNLSLLVGTNDPSLVSGLPFSSPPQLCPGRLEVYWR